MNERPRLTARQERIMDTIRSSVRDRGYPPSLRELTAAVGISSSSTAAEQLRILQARGYISITPNTPRGIMVLDPLPEAERDSLIDALIDDMASGPDADIRYDDLARYLVEKGWHR